jgi:hypothetical protein
MMSVLALDISEKLGKEEMVGEPFLAQLYKSNRILFSSSDPTTVLWRRHAG